MAMNLYPTWSKAGGSAIDALADPVPGTTRPMDWAGGGMAMRGAQFRKV
jgi:hypothetical protein